jgi:hypothetical protein
MTQRVSRLAQRVAAPSTGRQAAGAALAANNANAANIVILPSFYGRQNNAGRLSSNNNLIRYNITFLGGESCSSQAQRGLSP